jgi:hypothetical protein
LLALVGPIALVAQGCNSSVGSQQGYEPVQPIAFSHAQHAGENQTSCQYCHFGAEKSRHAGVPPVGVCLNCHSQVKKDSPEIAKLNEAKESGKPVEWVKVHRLPDYAYFDHSAHVGAGLQCQQCHGPVETMVRVRQVETMSMGWCLDCHRSLNDAAQAGGKQLHPPTDCAACHH